MKYKILIFIIVCFTYTMSSFAQNKEDDAKRLQHLIESQSFLIVSNWASPNATSSTNFIANSGLLPLGSSANNISLIGNTNYVKFIGDQVIGYLPFYGERQIGGGYNIRDNGISFEGIPEDLKIKEGRKGSYKISFRINDKNKESESYNVFIKLFPNHRSNISINTSHRTGINYSGAISESITKESNQ